MSDGKAEDGGEGSGSVFAMGGIRGRGCVSGTIYLGSLLLNGLLLVRERGCLLFIAELRFP